MRTSPAISTAVWRARLFWSGVTLLTVWMAADWRDVYPHLRAAALWLYQQATALNAQIAEPLNALRLSTSVPLLAPLLLGLMAATSPCQLSTGAAALANVSRDARSPLGSAAAYLAGRLVFYVAVGVSVMFIMGDQVQPSGPFFMGVRRVLGPLTLLIGLVILGVFRPQFMLGGRISERLETRARAMRGRRGSFALGLAFSFTFCPTLFFLFFGLTLPMAATAPLGWAYPAVFALGMTLPLLAFATLIPAQNTAGQGRYLNIVRAWRRVSGPLAGAVFVLAGVFDTFVYWLL